jgi:hypothetical protein
MTTTRGIRMKMPYLIARVPIDVTRMSPRIACSTFLLNIERETRAIAADIASRCAISS